MSTIMNNLFRAVQHIHKQTPLSLNDGKVLNGRVVELLPGNRAVVDIGRKQINARLETSLTRGRTYLFQVNADTTPVRLKVVSEQTKGGKNTPLQTWMNERGIKTNRQMMSFVKTLINRQIPFSALELKQAATILQGEKSGEAIAVMEDMFEKQLPIKNSVFQALAAGKKHQLSGLFRTLGEEGPLFSPASRASLLMNAILPSAAEGGFKETAKVKLFQEVRSNTQHSFQLLKQAGVISETETFNQFKENVLSSVTGDLAGKGLQTSGAGVGARSHIGNDMNNLFPISGKVSLSGAQTSSNLEVISRESAGSIQELFNRQLPVSPKQLQQLKGWTEQLRKIFHSKEAPSRALLEAFVINHRKLEKAGVFQKVTGTLTGEEGAVVRRLFDQVPGNMAKLLEMRSGSVSEQLRIMDGLRAVERSVSRQVPPHLVKVLNEWSIMAQKESPPPLQEKILLQMKAFQQLSGMDDESVLRQGRDGSEISMKSSLIQLITEKADPRGETARNLLQVFNSMQLTASQESAHSIQLTLQFPGQLMDADKDLHVLLEGEKTETGGISPDNCHILFYLDLQSLHETVIDMQVQNRQVYVTVYNDKEMLPRIAEGLKAGLREGMEKTGYSLGGLQVKQEGDKSATVESNFIHKKERGVDFRI